MPEINQNNQAEYSSDPSRASTIKKLNSSWRISSPIKRPKNHELQKESHVDVKDNLFGAKGDGVTDDTKAIQKAVDWLYSRGGGIILFPPGTYIVTSVDIREGITYQGYGATIKRPDHLTGKIGQEKSKWIRTFTTQKYPYSGQEDSPPLIIRGLTFDGSSQAQGFYKNYELEQASQVFLVGDKNYPGRLTAIIEDCNFKNGVADGVHAFINVKLKMQRCKTENIFRGDLS